MVGGGGVVGGGGGAVGVGGVWCLCRYSLTVVINLKASLEPCLSGW